MTDLEYALRRELRDRVEIAEQETRPAKMLASMIEQRAIRRRRRALGAGSAGLAVIVLAAAVVAARTLGGHAPTSPTSPKSQHGSAPLAHTALTPQGWAPVPYLGAQVSVPASWFVENFAGGACGGGVRGMIFVGRAPDKQQFRDTMGCPLAANIVVLVRFQTQPSPSTMISVRPNAVLNGIRVATERLHGGGELVIAPSLGIQVTARGPLASRVLATLTRSPLSVALAHGPAARTPNDWQWRIFGGITFAAPATWAVERDNEWPGCGFGIAARTIRLTTASAIFAASCPAPPDNAGFDAARPGVVVASGRYATLGLTQASYGNCRRINGLRACMLNDVPDGLLAMAVFPPGHPRPTIVEIGLAGSGAVARTILDSIRPAGR